jgi:hypothetical protein
VFDWPFLAEIVEVISELGSPVTVDHNRHAVCTDEQGDEFSNLFCPCLFTALKNVWETWKLVCKNQELSSFVAREVNVQGVEWVVCLLVSVFQLCCLARQLLLTGLTRFCDVLDVFCDEWPPDQSSSLGFHLFGLLMHG